MNDFLETIGELPIEQKLGIVFGTLLVIIAGYWFFVISSVSDELAELEEKIEGDQGLRFEITQHRGIADRLDEFTAEVKRLDIELNKALRELPDKKEIPMLLAEISGVALDAGLEVRLFKPREEQKKDYYAEVPVEMGVSGTYHQLATFFDEVGHLDRIVNLDQFSMIEPKIEDEVLLRTSVVATTFRFLDESERPKKDEKTAKKRRRRGGGKPAKK